MQKILNKVDFIIGSEYDLDNICEISNLKPFSDEVVELLDNVSKLILKDINAKQYPDVITFGFWCRRASVLKMKSNYTNSNLVGRGVSFHIAPSNVAVNFAYSMVTSLLAGNHVIVRLSSKEFAQTQFIVSAFNEALQFFSSLKIVLVKYERDSEINRYFSSICDNRLIWGGDSTIYEFKKYITKPRCIDISFADRKSLCVFNSDEFLIDNDKIKVIKNFYNDTFLNDQNACTSPKFIAFRGNIEGVNLFYNMLNEYVEEHYVLSESQAINKYVEFCRFSAVYGGSLLKENNYVYRIVVDDINSSTLDNTYNSGYFIEYYFNKFEDISPVLTDKCQTLSYYGFDIDEIKEFLQSNTKKSVDRVVPLGKTLDFSLKWDGYDLINLQTREITYI